MSLASYLCNMTLLRKNITLLIFLITIAPQVKGQADSIEEVSLRWLKENLTFNYPNPDQGKWWLNKMEYNLDEGTIHVQNASTVNPKILREKSWIDRRVNLSQLDPYSIAINPVLEHKGRIVKGSVLLIDVVHNEKKINKTIDGRRATSESFLQFSIPSNVLDTARGFADSLKFHLIQAIEAQSKLFNQNDPEENKKLIFQVLRGEFIQGSVTRTYGNAFQDVIEFQEKLGAKPLRKGYFGYDDSKGLYFEITVSDAALDVTYYRLNNGHKLALISIDDPNKRMNLGSLLHFTQLGTGGTDAEFRRISY